MEDFKERYEYNCVKEYIEQGVIFFKNLKEKGLKLSNTLDLNKSDKSKIVLLGDKIFSVKLNDDKLDFEINSFIQEVYGDEKGNFYTRMSKENDNPSFHHQILYDALLNHCVMRFKEVIK